MPSPSSVVTKPGSMFLTRTPRVYHPEPGSDSERSIALLSSMIAAQSPTIVAGSDQDSHHTPVRADRPLS
jgi:hypothetical protein